MTAGDWPFADGDAPAVLPRGPHGLGRDVVLASQRGRLLSAFVALAADRGVGAVTITDIVREAGTAKRTFYEHFRDKDDCFLQAFEAASQLMVGAVVERAGAEPDPIARIEVGARAYLEALIAHPEFARLFLTHMRAGGPQLAERWTAWVQTLADVLVAWRAESRLARPGLGELTRMQAVGAIAAVNEVVSMTLARDGIDGIAHVADELVAMTMAFLTADPRAGAAAGAGAAASGSGPVR